MKTLVILRHAKSDWADATLQDFDRPLNERGREAAPLMGRFIAQLGLAIDLVLVSSAKRTRETWALVEPHVGAHAKADIRRDLYLADADALMTALRQIDDEHERVMIIGHNPGLEDLVLALARKDQPRDGKTMLKRIQEKFPTCALAILRCDIRHWRDLYWGASEIVAYHTPREIA